MALTRELRSQLRRLEPEELRQVLLFARGLLVHVDGHPDPAGEPHLPPGVRYRQQHVRCGRASCSSCPHGPYWYAFWREDGRTRKRYIGRHLPGEPVEEVVPDLGGTSGPAHRASPPTGSPRAGAPGTVPQEH